MKTSEKQIAPRLTLPEDPLRAREFLGIQSSAIRVAQNPLLVKYARENHIPIGIPFFDSAMQGILPTDLVVGTGGSGLGKTSFGLEIAKNVAMRGHRVLMIPLESEPNEIEMKLEYQLFAGEYYYDKDKDKSVVFDYRSYRFGKIGSSLNKYYPKVKEIFKQRYATLETLYRKEGFNIENLREVFVYAKREGFKCIVLDHCHFIELYGDDPENIELSRLMKQIRDLNLHYNMPVFMLAHTRKTNKVMPGLEDIRGTSDIGKIATMGICIAPRPGSYDAKSDSVDTIFSVPKARTGGKLNLVGLVRYHIPMQSYVPEYRVARLEGDDVIELKKEELPYWAKGDPFCKNKSQLQEMEFKDEEDMHY